MLSKLAAQEYAAAGNLQKAMEIVDTMASRYDADESRLKVNVLAWAWAAAGSPPRPNRMSPAAYPRRP